MLLLAALGIGWARFDHAAQEEARQAEMSKRLTETEQAVDVAMAKAVQWRDQARELTQATSQQAGEALVLWEKAEAALGQAEAALQTGTGGDSLSQRVLNLKKQLEDGRLEATRRRAQTLRKAQLLHDLDEARIVRATYDGYTFFHANAVAKYAAAFAAYGMEAKAAPTQELAVRIRAEESQVREALIVALDDWANSASKANVGPSATELLASCAADDDAWRLRYRAASAGKNREDLLSLSAEPGRPCRLPFLCCSQQICKTNRNSSKRPLCYAGCALHPSDFFVHQHLGYTLAQFKKPTPVDREEEIGCYRAALALRQATPQLSTISAPHLRKATNGRRPSPSTRRPSTSTPGMPQLTTALAIAL